MGTSSSAEDYYDLLSHLLEEGQGQQASPPPPATVAPPPPPPPIPPRRRGRIPAWASAVRGCSIATCVLIVVLLVAPLAAQCRNKVEAFICVFILAMSVLFPVTAYVFTAEL